MTDADLKHLCRQAWDSLPFSKRKAVQVDHWVLVERFDGFDIEFRKTDDGKVQASVVVNHAFVIA